MTDRQGARTVSTDAPSALAPLHMVQAHRTFSGLSTCSYPPPTKASESAIITVPALALTNRSINNLWVAGPAVAAELRTAVSLSSSDGQWKTGLMAGLLARAATEESGSENPSAASAAAILVRDEGLWHTLLADAPADPGPAPKTTRSP